MAANRMVTQVVISGGVWTEVEPPAPNVLGVPLSLVRPPGMLRGNIAGQNEIFRENLLREARELSSSPGMREALKELGVSVDVTETLDTTETGESDRDGDARSSENSRKTRG